MSKIAYNSPSLLVTSFTLKNLLMQCSEESITLCARLVDGERLVNEPTHYYDVSAENIDTREPGTTYPSSFLELAHEGCST